MPYHATGRSRVNKPYMTPPTSPKCSHIPWSVTMLASVHGETFRVRLYVFPPFRMPSDITHVSVEGGASDTLSRRSFPFSADAAHSFGACVDTCRNDRASVSTNTIPRWQQLFSTMHIYIQYGGCN